MLLRRLNPTFDHEEAKSLAKSLAVAARESFYRDLHVSLVKKWLLESTGEQVQAVRDLIIELPSISEGMKHVLYYIFYPLDAHRSGRNEGYTAIHEALALRNGFYGPIVQNQQQFQFTMISELVLGLRTNSLLPLDVYDPVKKRSYEALIAFQFEMSACSAPLPTYQKRYKTTFGREAAVAISDPKLKELIINHADRIEDLIYYATSRTTLDAALLELMMRESVSPALNEGML